MVANWKLRLVFNLRVQLINHIGWYVNTDHEHSYKLF